MRQQLRTRGAEVLALAVVMVMMSRVVSLGRAEGLQVSLSHVSTLYVPTVGADGALGISFHTGTLEQMAIHLPSKMIYGVGNDVIHIINASDVRNLTSEGVMTLKDLDLTDAEVCGDALFITYRNKSDKLQGGVRVYGVYNSTLSAGAVGDPILTLLQDVPLGSLPDMVKPTPNCTLVVALENEGFVQGGKFYDPPGGVGIVRFPSGVGAEPDVTILNFTKFDAQFEKLSGSGVRWVFRGNGNNFSDNVEPEYVTFNHDYTKAYISLQENNAIAVVDLVTDTITDMHGLGFKAWGELDPSDRDGGIHIASWPVFGMYLPDEIKWFHWNDQDYVITANEGDAQEYPEPVSFSEEIRGNKIADADIADSVNNSLKAAFLDDTKLGRLKLSNVDGKNSEGKFERFYAYGGRSISIWRTSDMAQVFDSGSRLEKEHAQRRPDIFNSNVEPDDLMSQTVDSRSDNKGPETESLAVGEAEGHLLIFAGNERPGSIAVYSVAPGGMDPRFQTLFTGGVPPPARRRENSTWQQLFDDRELYGSDPEYIRFLQASQGLADFPVLLMLGTYSGTISVLKVDVVTPPPDTSSLATPSVVSSSPVAVLVMLLLWAAVP